MEGVAISFPDKLKMYGLVSLKLVTPPASG